MRIYAITIQNLGGIGKMIGSCIPKGSLGITVDDYNFKTYKWIGANDIDLDNEIFANVQKHYLDIIRSGGFKALFAQDGELVHIFGYSEGSTDRFANREIKLRIEEPSVMFPNITAIRQYSFKGCLCGSYLADRMVAVYLDTRIYNIGVKRARDFGNTFTSMGVTEALIERLSKAVVLGEPIQGDFNEGL